MNRYEYRQVKLVLAGTRWTGRWHVQDGEVIVVSAYGGTSCRVGRRKPERVAETVLLDILKAKLAAMEDRLTVP